MLTLETMGEAQIRRLYACQMRRDFPPSELKRLSSILTMREGGEYDVVGAVEHGTLMAYALLYRPREGHIALLDYLAVEPQVRGRGIGTQMLALLRERCRATADALLIECERPKAAPDEAGARRRIRFYTQAGAQLTSVRIWLFDVEYSILVLPCAQAMPARDWAQQMLSLYRQMLPPEIFARNVRLIRG